MAKHESFDLLLGPKWPRNWASESHIVHTSESSSKEHIKQDWCASRGNFATKYSKMWIVTHWRTEMAHKFGPLAPIVYTHTKVASVSLQNKFQVNPAEMFQENRRKPMYWPILVPFKGPENSAHMRHFSHIWKCPQYASKLIIMVPKLNTSCENGQ